MEKEIENRFKKVEKQVDTLDKWIEVCFMSMAILGILGVVFMFSVIF